MAWTEITRPKYRRDGLRYASDTTDEEWALLGGEGGGDCDHQPAVLRVVAGDPQSAAVQGADRSAAVGDVAGSPASRGSAPKTLGDMADAAAVAVSRKKCRRGCASLMISFIAQPLGGSNAVCNLLRHLH